MPCTSSVRPTEESTVRWSPVAATICLSISVTLSLRRSAAMTTLESRISPMQAAERFTMAIDDLFQVAPEVSVERHGRTVGFGQRDGFREQTARMRLRRAQHGHGPRVIFDDDFRACAHVGQQRRNVGRGGFCFRDVDHFLSHLVIIHHMPSLWIGSSLYKRYTSRVYRGGGAGTSATLTVHITV